MNNTVGFEDGRCYKIVSVEDSTVITVAGDKLVCEPQDDNKKDLQTFVAVAQDQGNFRLIPQNQAISGGGLENAQVWEYLSHKRKLILKKRTAAENSTQLWSSESVPGLDCVYFVLSSIDNSLCLKNANSSRRLGKQINLVEKESAQMSGDKATFWRLELQPIL